MRAAVVVLLVGFGASAARAEANELAYDLRIDVPVTLAATAVWLGTETFKGTLAPSCRWCELEVNPVDATTRASLRWNDPDVADVLSNITLAAAIPASAGAMVVAAGGDGVWHSIPIDLLLVAEAVSLSAAMNQVVKLTVARERPFVHVLSAEEKRQTNQPDDNNLSFYSGHANFAFALALSSGTVATLRGYSWAPWVWAIGIPIAVGTSYLRLGADRHYLSDIVVGAAAGSLIGFGIPFLHRPTESAMVPSIGAAPLDRGFLVSATWKL